MRLLYNWTWIWGLQGKKKCWMKQFFSLSQEGCVLVEKEKVREREIRKQEKTDTKRGTKTARQQISCFHSQVQDTGRIQCPQLVEFNFPDKVPVLLVELLFLPLQLRSPLGLQATASLFYIGRTPLAGHSTHFCLGQIISVIESVIIASSSTFRPPFSVMGLFLSASLLMEQDGHSKSILPLSASHEVIWNPLDAAHEIPQATASMFEFYILSFVIIYSHCRALWGILMCFVETLCHILNGCQSIPPTPAPQWGCRQGWVLHGYSQSTFQAGVVSFVESLSPFVPVPFLHRNSRNIAIAKIQ